MFERRKNMSGLMIDPEKLIEFFRNNSENYGHDYDISTVDELRRFLRDFVHREADFGFGFNAEAAAETDKRNKRKFEVVDILGSRGLICDEPGVLEGYCGQHECWVYYICENDELSLADSWPYALRKNHPAGIQYKTVMTKRKLTFREENDPKLYLSELFFSIHEEPQMITVNEFFREDEE